MGYTINVAYLGSKGVFGSGLTEGIPRNASLAEKLRIEKFNNEITIITTSGAYTLNAMPVSDAVLLFFYSYWWIIALIILTTIAVSAI